MINSSEWTRLVIELDALFDTRLGALATLDDEFAFNALMNGFPERWTDDPVSYESGCSTQAYQERYSKRDKDVLKLSHPTDFALDFKNIIEDLECRSFAGDPTVARKLEILVNYHPYKLTNDEIEAYVKSLRTIFKCITPIRMVSVDIAAMTTEWMKSRDIVGAYIYNYSRWVDEVITRRLMQGQQPEKIPEVVAYFPTLMLDATQAKVIGEYNNEFDGIPDVFASLKFHLKEWISVDWVNSIYYSISPTVLFPEIEPKEPELEPEPDEMPVDRDFLI